MLKKLIQLVSVIVATMISLLGLLGIANSQDTFPISSKRTVLIDFSSSPLSRVEQLSGLAKVSGENHISLYKVTATKEDRYFGTDLFVIAGEQPPENKEISWLDPSRHGSIRPVKDFGASSLQGSYLVFGDENSWQHLDDWLVENKAKTRWLTKGSHSATWAGLTGMGMPVVPVALAVLLLSTIMAWYSSLAKSRAIRTINGKSPLAIRWDDQVSFWKIFLPPLGIVQLIATVIVALNTDKGLAWEFLFVTGTYWAMGVSIILGASLVISLLLSPSAQSLVSRNPFSRRFTRLSEVLKFLALLLALLTIPSFLLSSIFANEIRQRNEHWGSLIGYGKIRISSGGNDQYLDQLSPALGQALNKWNKKAGVTINYSVENRSVVNDECDGLIITDQTFLHKVGINVAKDSTIQAITPVDLTPSQADYLSQQVPIFQRNKTQRADEHTALYRFHNKEGLAALAASGMLRIAQSGLILVVDNPVDFFNDRFLLAAASSGNLLIGDPDEFSSFALENGIGALISGVERASDVGILAAQTAQREIWYRAFALIISATILIFCIATSAQAYVWGKRKTIFTLRSAGWLYYQILRVRLLVELAGCILVTYLAYLGWKSNQAFMSMSTSSPTVFLICTAIFYISFSVLSHLWWAKRSFKSSILREVQ